MDDNYITFIENRYTAKKNISTFFKNEIIKITEIEIMKSKKAPIVISIFTENSSSLINKHEYTFLPEENESSFRIHFANQIINTAKTSIFVLASILDDLPFDPLNKISFRIRYEISGSDDDFFIKPKPIVLEEVWK